MMKIILGFYISVVLIAGGIMGSLWIDPLLKVEYVYDDSACALGGSPFPLLGWLSIAEYIHQQADPEYRIVEVVYSKCLNTNNSTQ